MITPGYCMVCNAKTHTECGHCGTKKFTDQHTEVEMTWSNGAKMKIGVCNACARANAQELPENKLKITAAHHDHWAISDRAVTLV